jgi:hypothetical protein
MAPAWKSEDGQATTRAAMPHAATAGGSGKGCEDDGRIPEVVGESPMSVNLAPLHVVLGQAASTMAVPPKSRRLAGVLGGPPARMRFLTSRRSHP